jgi:hypothetical protein
MGLRWYSTVIDSTDPRALARWWADALRWTTVYEADDEVVIVPAHMGEAGYRETPWAQAAPGLVFVRVPEEKAIKNRLHLDLAPHTSDDRDAEIARLKEMGATEVDVGQGPDVTWAVLADPQGNEFCVLSSRDMGSAEGGPG